MTGGSVSDMASVGSEVGDKSKDDKRVDARESSLNSDSATSVQPMTDTNSIRPIRINGTADAADHLGRVAPGDSLSLVVHSSRVKRAYDATDDSCASSESSLLSSACSVSGSELRKSLPGAPLRKRIKSAADAEYLLAAAEIHGS